MSLKYKRILIKISGEALGQKLVDMIKLSDADLENKPKNDWAEFGIDYKSANKTRLGIDYNCVKPICDSIKKCVELGVEVAVVVGGGNFWRGRSSLNDKIDRAASDTVGMLGTAMNALVLSNVLNDMNVDARVQTAYSISSVAEPYEREKAIRHIKKGTVLIFGCGTGNPFFSTDTAAAMRAAEINAEILLKATNTDGVYNKDPNLYDDAVKYDTITFSEIITNNLAVIDSAAAIICRDNNIPALIFNIDNPDNIVKALQCENIGTIVK